MNLLKKEFNFAISHRLEDHKGLCNNVHGHNYKLFVTVKRTDNKLITKDENISSEGMVVDFKDLKNIVNTRIIDKLDHAFVFNKESNVCEDIANYLVEKINQKIYPLSCKTTAENMSKCILEELNKYFILNNIQLKCIEIELYETESSMAIYKK